MGTQKREDLPSDGTIREDSCRDCGVKLKIKFGWVEIGRGQFRERESKLKGRSRKVPNPWQGGGCRRESTEFKGRNKYKPILWGLNSTWQIHRFSIQKYFFLFLLENCLQTDLYLMRSLNIITFGILHAYFIALLNPSNNIVLGGIINLFRTLPCNRMNEPQTSDSLVVKHYRLL